MKHFLLALATIVCSCLFAGCDTTKGDDDAPVICPGYNPFGEAYTIDDDGFCTDKGSGMIPEDEVKKRIVGHGWKVIGTYEVRADGYISTTDYWKDMIGGGTTDLWFVSESKVVKFYNDSDIRKKYAAMPYSYDADRGFILLNSSNAVLSETDRYMQIMNFVGSGDKQYLFTVQKIAIRSTADGTGRPVFAMVAYQRMTDGELAKKKAAAKYDADKDDDEAVPNSCKFRVTASYYNPDDGETSGAVVMAFRKVLFSLTDNLGTTMLPNPALEYFDSIVWRSYSLDLPGKYRIHKHESGSEQTKVQWTAYFLDKTPNLVSCFDGYKDGRVVYAYEMRHDIYPDKFLCYDWSTYTISKPREFVASNPLDKSRSFTVYEPRIYDGDMNKVYAELRYNSEPKGKGNDINILEKEAGELTALMASHYSRGTNVGKQIDAYRKLFKALPEKADIKTFWETSDTRIALVLNADERDAQNRYYYVHAEPK